MIAFLAQVPSRVVGSAYLGIIIPALVFFSSFLLAFLLYRHFTKKQDDSE